MEIQHHDQYWKIISFGDLTLIDINKIQYAGHNTNQNEPIDDELMTKIKLDRPESKDDHVSRVNAFLGENNALNIKSNQNPHIYLSTLAESIWSYALRNHDKYNRHKKTFLIP